MALLAALTRGIIRFDSDKLGNFWVDLVRSVLYILLPLSFILSLVLVSQGVIQNFKSYQTVSLIDPIVLEKKSEDSSNATVKSQNVVLTQKIPMGPVASQICNKTIGY